MPRGEPVVDFDKDAAQRNRARVAGEEFYDPKLADDQREGVRPTMPKFGFLGNDKNAVEPLQSIATRRHYGKVKKNKEVP